MEDTNTPIMIPQRRDDKSNVGESGKEPRAKTGFATRTNQRGFFNYLRVTRNTLERDSKVIKGQ